MSISKDSHLDIAIACLTHINNGLFQRRAGLSADAMVERTSTWLSADQLSKGPKASEAIGTTSSSKLCDMFSTLSERDLQRFDDADESDRNSDSSMGDIDQENAGPIISKTDWVDDRAHVAAPRYEIHYWPYHLQEAERQWTPKETANDKWARLFAELDNLAYEERGIFNAWEKKYQVSSSRGVFSLAKPRKPLRVAAYLGLTSWAEHVIKQGECVNELSGGCNAVQAAASGATDWRTMLRLLLEAGVDVIAENGTAPPSHVALG